MLQIEKTIKLLDDFHYDVFREYVKNLSLRSYYPLALIDIISRDVETEQDAERLCYDVYSASDEKTMKKFYQLAHYTFKLIAYLSKNYPDYLQHNFTRIQQLINEGDLEKANTIAQLVLDISEKIEDYETHTKVLQFLTQQSVLMESTKQALNYLEETGVYQEYIITLNSIFTHFYTYYNLKQKDKADDAENYYAFYRQYFNHESIKIRLTSIYCYCFLLQYKKSELFYTQETYTLLDQLEKDFEKYDYILFPYLVDFAHRVRYLKLRFNMQKSSTEEVLDNSLKIIGGNQDILYWKSYINQPEIISVTTQANYLASYYMKSFRDDYEDFLTEEIKDRIQLLLVKCRQLLENKMLQEVFSIRYIILTTTYALILLINGKKENLEEAIERLNLLLFNYQQLSFHKHMDSIYSILGTAYFCLRDFKKVDENYRRYKKAIKDKPVNPSNDITIHVFYYTSKWLETQRTQYVKKLESILQETNSPQLSGIRDTFIEIVDYFEVPVSFAK